MRKMYGGTLAERINFHTTLTANGCRVWDGFITPSGYGRITVDGRSCLVHRIAYEVFKGPIPKGLTIDHLCRNRSCVNPEHLESVTGRENTLRGFGVSALNHRKTRCFRGHPYNDENTYVRTDGTRQCRVCRRVAA